VAGALPFEGFLTETVKGASTQSAGQLRIGDGGALTAELIAPALRRLRRHWPGLRLSFVQNTSEGFFDDLLENRIDCAFPALEPRSIEIASHQLGRLEIGLVLPPGHRLAHLSEIRLERLENERWILPPREANPFLYDELISCCQKAGFSPDVIAEMTQRPRAISQVATRRRYTYSGSCSRPVIAKNV